jgi:hypothetical protein
MKAASTGNQWMDRNKQLVSQNLFNYFSREYSQYCWCMFKALITDIKIIESGKYNYVDLKFNLINTIDGHDMYLECSLETYPSLDIKRIKPFDPDTLEVYIKFYNNDKTDLFKVNDSEMVIQLIIQKAAALLDKAQYNYVTLLDGRSVKLEKGVLKHE